MRAAACVLLACCALLARALPYVKVNPDTQRFVDEYGRTIIFHGVNAVYKEPPYYPNTDVFDPQLSLTDEDMQHMEEWGVNAVRLGVMWPGVAPSKGQVDSSYLAKMKSIAQQLATHNIYTLVDFHQDLLSDMLCGEGAPDWATYIPEGTAAFPSPVNVTLEYDPITGYPTIESCLQLVFGEYYFSEAVSAAFQSLYSNASGIQDSFIDYWGALASTFADVDGVLGYEIINEPWAGDLYRDISLLLPTVADKKNLAPLYERAHNIIRKYDTKHLLFFEKTIVNVLGPTGFTTGPGGSEYNDRNVYSYHNYCGSVDNDGDPRNVFVCDGEETVEWFQEMEDIKNLKCGSAMTEFGAMGGNNTKTIESLNFLMDLSDSYVQSWMYWQFKSFDDITTVSNDAESFYCDNGALQTDKVQALSRTYPQAVAGTIKSYNFDWISGDFTLNFLSDETIKTPTIIYTNNQMWYPKGYSVSVLPAGVASMQQDGNHLEILTSASTAMGTSITVTIKRHEY
eukprot:TRINITY_DN216_c0_g1_i1.p1 TRINITY_DN216_c0_g1~~TRINITY_DN216_c0_g1_i1.p1  ORF type:complete len:511 (+),score=116.74 TRINITY_DN216_c0_g1_i1:17-1549(+)